MEENSKSTSSTPNMRNNGLASHGISRTGQGQLRKENFWVICEPRHLVNPAPEQKTSSVDRSRSNGRCHGHTYRLSRCSSHKFTSLAGRKHLTEKYALYDPMIHTALTVKVKTPTSTRTISLELPKPLPAVHDHLFSS